MRHLQIILNLLQAITEAKQAGPPGMEAHFKEVKTGAGSRNLRKQTDWVERHYEVLVLWAFRKYGARVPLYRILWEVEKLLGNYLQTTGGQDFELTSVFQELDALLEVELSF